MAIIDKFCPINEAAGVIGCTHARVRQLCLDGTLKGEKMSDAPNAPWIIDRKSVEKYASQSPTVGRKRTGEKNSD